MYEWIRAASDWTIGASQACDDVYVISRGDNLLDDCTNVEHVWLVYDIE